MPTVRDGVHFLWRTKFWISGKSQKGALTNARGRLAWMRVMAFRSGSGLNEVHPVASKILGAVIFDQCGS